MGTFLQVIGALAILFVAFHLVRSIPDAVRGLRQTVDLHRTMYAGMRLNGRTPVWTGLPRSLLTHFLDLAAAGKDANITIRGSGYSWTTKQGGLTWKEQEAQRSVQLPQTDA